MLGKKRQQYLRCCTDYATACHMTTEHSTARVGNRHVQMRSIRGYRPSKRQDFQIVAQLGRILIPGESQLGNAEAPDALDHESRPQVEPTQHVFEGDTQIAAGRKAQRMGLHYMVPGSALGNRLRWIEVGRNERQLRA